MRAVIYMYYFLHELTISADWEADLFCKRRTVIYERDRVHHEGVMVRVVVCEAIDGLPSNACLVLPSPKLTPCSPQSAPSDE